MPTNTKALQVAEPAGIVAGKNAIINGGFDIWQRGTSSAATANIYTADRWQKGAATSFTVSRQATGDTTNLPNIQYCARVQRTAGSTSTTLNDFGQTLETINSIPFAGKTITMSFYARAGANYSTTSNAFAAHIYTGTGTDQAIMSGLTGSAIAATVNATLTTTWQRFQATAIITSAATELAFYCYSSPTGTAGANDYFEITGVQLELGNTATPFSRAGGTIQGELAACQRYYWRQTGTNIIPYAAYANETTKAFASITYPTVMRTAPTSLDYSSLELNYPGNANYSVTAVALNGEATNGTTIQLTSSGLTQFRPYLLKTSGSGYIGFSAEL